MIARGVLGTSALVIVVTACGGDDVNVPTRSTRAEAQGAGCCSEFQVGVAVDASIAVDPAARVAAQAIADFAAASAATVLELTGACRTIAEALDTPSDALTEAEVRSDDERLAAFCDLAARSIASLRSTAGGTIDVQASAPGCAVPIAAKSTCQASCAPPGACDAKAHPPSCLGGALSIACHGGCTASGGATSVRCSGSCDGACSGACAAPGGVACAGTCEGLCKGAAEGGTGAGIQADGRCEGSCFGRCLTTPPATTCPDACDGACTGTCRASATSSVKCDGVCDAPYELLSCTDGMLGGGCAVDPQCDDDCTTSASMKAQCPLPTVRVMLTDPTDPAAAGRLKNVLEQQLGVFLVAAARVSLLAPLIPRITRNADALVNVKSSCIPKIVAASITAAGNQSAVAHAVSAIVSTTQ